MMSNGDNIRGNRHERFVRWVKKVLRRWDPIGIIDAAPDEYDSYAPEIAELLERGVGKEKIARHLCLIEESSMGLMPNLARAERIARILVFGFRGEIRPKGDKRRDKGDGADG